MRRVASLVVFALVQSAFPADGVAQVVRGTGSSIPSVPAIAPTLGGLSAPSLNAGLAAAFLTPALTVGAPAPSLMPALVPSAVPAALVPAAAIPAAAKPVIHVVPMGTVVDNSSHVNPALTPIVSGEGKAEASAPALDGAILFDGRAAASASDGAPNDPEPAVRIPRERVVPQRFTSRLARWTGAAALYSIYRDGVLVQRYASRLNDRSLSPARRASASRMLASLGRLESVPVLGYAYENDPSPRVRAAARAALLHLAVGAQSKLIRSLRASPRSGARSAAAATLAWLVASSDAPEALEALSNAATLDRSEDVRLEAIRALTKARDPKAAAALQWALASEARPHMRSALELALAESRARHEGLGLRRAPSSEDLAESQSPLREVALKRALAVSAVFVAIELAGGFLTGNVALKADAFHLAADQLINGAALFSIWVSRRPPNSRKSYGYLKVEPVVGLLGAAAIAFMGFEMGAEAWHRLFAAGEPATWSVALFALCSLAANLLSALILWRHKDEGLSMKGAFLHAATDAVGSVGVIVSAAAAILLGWTWVEPVAVALIVAMIAKTAWELGKPSWNVLIDAVPEGVSLDRVEADLLAIPGVAGVRDLHVWALNSRVNSLTAILYIREGESHERTLASAKAVLKEKHGIGHVTVQVETLKPEP